MDAKQAMEIFRKEIAEVKAKNLESVTVEGLEKFVEYIEARADLSGKDLTAQMEHYKAQTAANLAQYNAERTMDVEMFRSVIAAGQNATKSATLINGGADVALLAFIGHVWDKALAPNIVRGLTWSLLLFVSGVLASAIAGGATYFSQALYAGNWERTGHAIKYITIGLVGMSYPAFAMGGYEAYSAFRAQLTEG